MSTLLESNTHTDIDNNISTMMDITVLYFASLADEAHCHEEKITVPQSTSLTGLYEQLRQKHRFSRPQSELRVAVIINPAVSSNLVILFIFLSYFLFFYYLTN